MFKLVVLCAFFAAVAAKPDVLISPFGSYSTYISPATTTITKQASSVIHPSPLIYNTPIAYSHFIKKRSPQLSLGYYGPTSYVATSPVGLSTHFSSPLVQTTSILPAVSPWAYSTAHLIKKRSAALVPTSYIAPSAYAAATAPLYSNAYTVGSPFLSSPLLSQPIAYPTHFIKKRSAPLLTYTAPSSYSHQSRIDIEHSPLVYSSPVVYNRLYDIPI